MQTITLPPAELAVWNGFTPPVKQGSEETFWCAVRGTNGKIFHRFLQYANRYVMPLSDSCDSPPKGAVPVGDDGEFEWTGWFERSCENCDTQWEFSGEVVAWMVLPRFPQPCAAINIPASPAIVHGVSCQKWKHDSRHQGYLHGADHDGPYDVDGVAYCGRCHHCLPQ